MVHQPLNNLPEKKSYVLLLMFCSKVIPVRFVFNTNLFNSLSYSTCRMTKKAVVLIASGSEEMEFVISVDVLRRAGVSDLAYSLTIYSYISLS